MNTSKNNEASKGREFARDVDIDFYGLLSSVWAKKSGITITAVVTFVILFVILVIIPPRYQSTSRVLIENRESVYTRNDREASQLFDREAVQSQVEILRADDIAMAVIEKLQLDKHWELARPLNIFSTARINSIFGIFRSDSVSMTPTERAMKRLREKLELSAVRDSRVINIRFKSKDQKLARDVPNAFADEYIKVQKDANLSNTRDATQWLGPEIDELRERVRLAEARVAQYRSSSDILQGRDQATLATQQLSETSTELSRLRAERSSAEGKVKAIRAALNNGASIDVVPEVISSPLIQRLREGEVQLRAEISEMETTLLPNHPELKALKSQVQNYQNQIRSAARDILGSLENNVATTKNQEKDLIAELNRLKAESARVDEAGVELRVLEREAAAEREQLEAYLRNFREANSRQSSLYQPVNARIISRAGLPTEPYFPLIFPFALAGALIVMILQGTWIITASLLSGPDLSRFTNKPERGSARSRRRYDQKMWMVG